MSDFGKTTFPQNQRLRSIFPRFEFLKPEEKVQRGLQRGTNVVFLIHTVQQVILKRNLFEENKCK